MEWGISLIYCWCDKYANYIKSENSRFLFALMSKKNTIHKIFSHYSSNFSKLQIVNHEPTS
jgi:hypothetical protein